MGISAAATDNSLNNTQSTSNTLLKENSNSNTVTTTETYSKYQAAGSDSAIDVYNPQQVITAASNTKKYIETYKKLPSNVHVGTRSVNMAQLLHLMTSATIQMNAKDNSPIPLTNDQTSGTAREQMNSGVLSKSEYLDFAKRIKYHLDINFKAPSYGVVGLGQVSHQSQIYLYSRVLTTYKATKSLPNNVYMKPWSKNNIPITNQATSFTPKQIAAASVNLKAYIEKNKTLPNTVNIGSNTVNLAQFLQLMTTATVQINKSDNSPITLQNANLPGSSQEQMTSGKLSKAEYIDFVQRIMSHINSNSQAPPYGVVGLGQISFQSMIYQTSRIMTCYQLYGSLPSSVVMKPWTALNPNSMTRPIYITSDNITDAGAKDINRINTIVNGLKALGLTAVNFGLGPNTHIKVLTANLVPKNALVIDIYGGACAGTLYEMGSNWYKSIRGTKKVFTVFIPPAKDINGLDWLTRAHDDNFSPASFTGLAHPDQFLLDNGYHFLRSGDYSAIINAILLEART